MFKSSRFHTSRLTNFSTATNNTRTAECIDLTEQDDSFCTDTTHSNAESASGVNNGESPRSSILSLPGQSDFALQRARAIERKKQKDRYKHSPFKPTSNNSPGKRMNHLNVPERNLFGSPHSSSCPDLPSAGSPTTSLNTARQHNGFVRSSALLSPTKLAIYRTQHSGSNEQKQKVSRGQQKRARMRVDDDCWPSSSGSSDEEILSTSNKRIRSDSTNHRRSHFAKRIKAAESFSSSSQSQITKRVSSVSNNPTLSRRSMYADLPGLTSSERLHRHMNARKTCLGASNELSGITSQGKKSKSSDIQVSLPTDVAESVRSESPMIVSDTDSRNPSHVYSLGESFSPLDQSGVYPFHISPSNTSSDFANNTSFNQMNDISVSGCLGYEPGQRDITDVCISHVPGRKNRVSRVRTPATTRHPTRGNTGNLSLALYSLDP